ncbi:hypothetical protein Tco_1249457 [Tanacetum coccineum]
MQKNVLKHQFENFSTASNESLDKAYDRFQKLISQLEVHGAPISKEDINQKFLKYKVHSRYGLPPSWNKIALIMRNKPDIDEIDIDRPLNNLRVYLREKNEKVLQDEYAIRKKIIESKTTDLNTKTSETVGKTNEANTQKPKTVYESVNRDKVIIEDWNSDDEDDVSEVQTISPVKTNKTQTVKTRDDKSGQNSKKQGISFRKVKAYFVCKSTDHLIKDCNFHDKKSQEPKLKNVVNTVQREGKPVWDNTRRVNHQNFSKYLHLRKAFVPS